MAILHGIRPLCHMTAEFKFNRSRSKIEKQYITKKHRRNQEQYSTKKYIRNQDQNKNNTVPRNTYRTKTEIRTIQYQE